MVSLSLPPSLPPSLPCSTPLLPSYLSPSFPPLFHSTPPFLSLSASNSAHSQTQSHRNDGQIGTVVMGHWMYSHGRREHHASSQDVMTTVGREAIQLIVYLMLLAQVRNWVSHVPRPSNPSICHMVKVVAHSDNWRHIETCMNGGEAEERKGNHIATPLFVSVMFVLVSSHNIV